MKTTLLLPLILYAPLFSASLGSKPLNNSLVIYNSNIGLVHEERTLILDKRDRSIVYEGVASTIETDSVNVKLPKELTLYSQQYRYDALTQRKLLQAHIGKKIHVGKRSYILLSFEGKNSLVKDSKSNIITVKTDTIIFSSIPKTLLTKPSLVWNIKTAKKLKSTMQLDYLIKNIRWSSNYILNIDKNRADLIGWITVQNNSGKAFKDTQLLLLAGDINRVQAPQLYKSSSYVKAMAVPTPVKQEAHEGYHIYTVPFKVQLANHEKTQLKFLTKKHFTIQRKYTAQLSNPLYLQGERVVDVSQYISMKGFDTPLPKGTVRIYSKLHTSTILLGEVAIKHTPKATPLSLKTGKNFDIKVKETLTNKQLGNNYTTADLNYTLTNNSDETKKVQLLIPFNKNRSSSLKSKEKYTFTKGNLVTFSITVAANTTKSFAVHYESKK